MTVENTTSIVQYDGDGVATVFPVPFRFFENTDLDVVRVTALDVVVPLTLGTDYTVSGAGEINGGSITTSLAAATGEQIVIARLLPLTQETDLRNQGNFFPEIHEDVFDRLTMLIQQLSAVTGRALTRPRDGVNWDAQNRRINNLGSAQRPTDAANLGDVTGAVNSAITGEALARAEGDANLQRQIGGQIPLESSRFSPISWHDQDIGNSVTIPSYKNAWTFGPQITIDEGQVITIGEGSFWTVADGEEADSTLDLSVSRPGTGIKRTVSQTLLDMAVTPQQYGDVQLNAYQAITLAAASGRPIEFPAGDYYLPDMLQFTTDQVWVTSGKVRFIANFPAGSAAKPVFDFRGKITSYGDFTVDHQANTKNYAVPTVYAGNPIAGSAVLVQGDWSSLEDWKILNAWDNGLSAIRLDISTGNESPGLPKYGSFRNIKTQGCGVGIHAALTPGKIGAGIDIGSASAWTVSDCVDFQSYIGFILDVGAGAQCQFSNCVAWYTVLDSSNPTNGSGYGFYVGSSESSFVNCYSVGAGYRGWWIDEVGNDFVNCGAYIPQQEGVFIKCGQFKASFRVKGAGFKQANTYDAVLIDCSAKAITELELELHTTGSNHRYGVNATGSKTIDAHVTGSVTGTTGIINRGTFNIGSFIQNASVGSGKKFGLNRENPGMEWDVYGRSRVSADRANLSSTAGGSAFGDSTANGTQFIEDFATPGKRMAQGWDPVNDSFVTQSMHAGTAKKPYWINPAGGEVMAGTGLFNEPLRLGNYRLWVDGAGALRIKNGAPTSATDGTVVGSQA